MKRFTVLLICIISCALSAANFTVYAATPTYARATVRDAYFFAQKSNSSSLFIVPYTYCVEVLADDGDWYRVRYGGNTGLYEPVTGYCRKQDFTVESGTPAVTFLYKTVTVNYKADGSNSTLPVLNEIAVEAAFYGTYYSGATAYSYVLCQGNFGYIEGANDDYPLNEITPQEPTGGEDKGGQSKASGWSAGLIALTVISALALTVIAVIYFTTHKPRADA